MGLPQPRHEVFSYAHYLTWNDGKRWEIVNGEAFNMSPAPSTKHQKIATALTSEFYFYLKNKPCQVFAAPFDVRLSEKDATDEEVLNVVQPDISIICNSSKIDLRGAKGAPDLIVEILSEWTQKTDLNVKLLLYQHYGVREYWIIDPIINTVTVHKLDASGKYFIDKIYNQNDKLQVGILPELFITLTEIFLNV